MTPTHWISPTAASRLLRCPASVTALPAGDRPSRPTARGSNAGTAAHEAISSWLLEGDLETPAALGAAFDSALEQSGLRAESVSDGRVTRARLVCRAAEIAAIVARGGDGHGPEVHSEVTLHDDARRLWGTIDLLLVTGAFQQVLDIKSGADGAAEHLADELVHQLLIYGLLAAENRGAWPSTLAVFSLHLGVRVVQGSREGADELWSRVHSARDAWAEGDRPTRPDPQGCYFCSRRLDCDPHWAAAGASGPSGIEGTILQVSPGENGRVAVRVETANGELWISNLRLATGSLVPVGGRLRAVRLKLGRRDEEGRVTGLAASGMTDARVT